jgi:hypothetical protein
MVEKKVDFIKDESFRSLVSFFKEAQREFEQAETDDAIELTQAKLNYARALLDSHIRQAKRNRNLIREVNLKRHKNAAVPNRPLAKISSYIRKHTRHEH